MRRLTLVPLIVISGLLLTGCNPKSMMNHSLDPTLPKVLDVKAIVDSTSVGFEWQPLDRKGIDGVNIYRTKANAYTNSEQKELEKIGTVSSRFSSHYVDTGLKQNSKYTYTFTTTKGDKESSYGKVIEVKTLQEMVSIGFFQGVQKTNKTIKLIWRPHQDKRVEKYYIQRSVNKENWKRIATVSNRLMVEYIDNYVITGKSHQYRIVAVGFDGSRSKATHPVTILAK
ncbi:MAG: hypothetical protein KAG56_03650 [Sulfurovaceae bacterium]|nr:hypothetical protein [Sulfurovaceae bacterium]